jgi:hypothetical protein
MTAKRHRSAPAPDSAPDLTEASEALWPGPGERSGGDSK